MNGIHDMGGMHGLGAIEHPADEPLFHAPWEARALAVTLAASALGRWNIDASRHQRELIPAAEYLRMSYYERWIAGLGELLVNAGLVTRAELENGRADQPARPVEGVSRLAAENVAAMLARGAPASRDIDRAPRFKPGDAVRARNINPTGHTRLPRYARGKHGVIRAGYGAHVFADSNAHFRGENPQHLYSVRFTARELWGDAAAPGDAVYIDLWDDHLDPA